MRAAGIDITGQKQLEEQFRESQKMEAVGNSAGGIAHDLLSVMSGYSQLLAERFQDDAATVQDFAEIRHAVDSAAALTRQLLAFSRKQILLLSDAELIEPLLAHRRLNIWLGFELR